MQTLELIGVVDEQLQLHVQLPDWVTPGPVRVLVMWPDSAEEAESDFWADWRAAKQKAQEGPIVNDNNAV